MPENNDERVARARAAVNSGIMSMAEVEKDMMAAEEEFEHPETQPAAYSNDAPEQPMTRLQQLVLENMELKELLAIERDHVDKCRAWADELGRNVDALGMAVRMLKEELAPQQPMPGPDGCPGALTPLETSTGPEIDDSCARVARGPSPPPRSTAGPGVPPRANGRDW